MFHGKGTLSRAEKIYTGDFQKGKFHGHGMQTWSNGLRYVGQFVDDKADGRGFYEINGQTFVGTFKEGKMCGLGHQKMTNGDQYIGQFQDGKKHGSGIETTAAGLEFLVKYESGVETERVPVDQTVKIEID